LKSAGCYSPKVICKALIQEPRNNEGGTFKRQTGQAESLDKVGGMCLNSVQEIRGNPAGI